jgi:hypothetical protein
VPDLDGVRAMKRYWEFVTAAVRAGKRPAEIVRSLDFAEFAGWDAPARIAVNAAIIAREEHGSRVPDHVRMGLIAQMGELAAELAA